MFKQLFGKRPTTRVDVILAFAAAGMAVLHAIDVKKQYATETTENEENSK